MTHQQNKRPCAVTDPLHCRNLADVIFVLGGLQATADLLGCSKQSVRNWKAKGRFRAAHYVLIEKALSEKGFRAPLRLFNFIGLGEPIKEAPLQSDIAARAEPPEQKVELGFPEAPLGFVRIEKGVKLSGWSKTTMYKFMNAGLVESTKVGKLRFVNLDSIDRIHKSGLRVREEEIRWQRRNRIRHKP